VFRVERSPPCSAPSGAGKSTLLNVIAGFEPLAEGSVMLDSRDMTMAGPADRPVTAVFQDHNSFAHLDAWSNVALGLSPTLSLDTKQRNDVDRALDLVGLSALAKRRPGDMSGGERQRIAIARVLGEETPDPVAGRGLRCAWSRPAPGDAAVDQGAACQRRADHIDGDAPTRRCAHNCRQCHLRGQGRGSRP
jgi:ABC-type cobalamin transport system ATPase subunit